MRITIHRLAELELGEAVSFHEERRTGLGLVFLETFLSVVQSIGRHPDAGEPQDGDVRRRLLTRFPYAVLYRRREGEIRILALAHLRRRPGYWVGRS